MKILNLIIFTLVAIIIVSCDIFEPSAYADDFFPLRVGDRFVYRYSLRESFSNTLHGGNT